jgi:hypothetical protein
MIEILVFSRQERCLHPVGDGLDRQEQPPLMRVLCHQLTGGGMHPGGYRRLVAVEHFVIRQILRDISYIPGNTRRHDQKHHGPDSKEVSNQSYHQSATVCVLVDPTVRDACDVIEHAAPARPIRMRKPVSPDNVRKIGPNIGFIPAARFDGA